MTPFSLTSLRATFRRVGSRTLGALLLAVILLGGAGSLHAETRSFNMWWAPECVTKGGHETDKLLMVIFWLTLAVFILTQTVYIVFLVKYRYRKGVKAVYSHGNNKLEIIWTTIPAMPSSSCWRSTATSCGSNCAARLPPTTRCAIDIVAYQFGFHIRNPGA